MFKVLKTKNKTCFWGLKIVKNKLNLRSINLLFLSIFIVFSCKTGSLKKYFVVVVTIIWVDNSNYISTGWWWYLSDKGSLCRLKIPAGQKKKKKNLLQMYRFALNKWY